MIGFFISALYFITVTSVGNQARHYPAYTEDTVVIHKTADFVITGAGDNPAWSKTWWQHFIKIDSGGRNYETKSKMLYSDKGIYVLFAGEDSLITTKDYKDDDEIYEGDVFEFFLQTDPAKPPYFEYEINQLDKQLVLILSGSVNKNLAWSPWRYEYNRSPLIRKKVSVTTKKQQALKPGIAIKTWMAEIFFPFEVLGLLPGVPPERGTAWRGNFCRIDYDSGKMIQWTWSKKIRKSFHELENFGTILFE